MEVKLETFICESCKREFPFILKGGTDKLIGDPLEYSDEKEAECAYCKGFYPDGTLCTGGKKKR